MNEPNSLERIALERLESSLGSVVFLGLAPSNGGDNAHFITILEQGGLSI